MPLQNVVIDLYHGDTIDPNSGFHDIVSDGIVAIIHKATQGSGSVDTEYFGRRSRARSVGLLWGSYHFGVGGDPVGQADHYLHIVGPQKGELICLDFEASSHGQMQLSEAEAFVNRVHQTTGQFPVLYSGQSFLLDALGNKKPGDTVLSKCPLWIARYSSQQPQIPPAFGKFTLWQYTGDDEGPDPHHVKGILNPVDREQFNGTLADLKTFWASFTFPNVS
jgi:lysozyme